MQTIFITGCANGIGKHLVEKLQMLDYQVVATDIDFEKLQSHQWNPQKVHLEKLDVSNSSEWQLVIEKCVRQFDKIDILINNAGVIVPSFVGELSIKSIDFQVDINLKGVMYGTKYAADVMLKQGSGHIINFASLAGVAPIQGLPVYSATKFGVRAFSLAAHQELKKRGIHVSVICPDLVDTNMLTVQLDHEAANLTFSGNKILTVSEIADAVLKRAIWHKEVEILIPKSRGFLAKIGNFFPLIADFLTNSLTKKGNQNRLKIQNNSDSKNARYTL
jgi:3-oxoacyl-[acyl-carrier protein] reductase